MSDEEFFSFLQMCRDELEVRQPRVVEISPLGSAWHFDLAQGTIQVSEGVFSIIPIGTHSAEYGTWLWAWANEDFPASARAASKRLQALHTVTGFQVFVDPGSKATSKDAQDFAAMAVHCLGAIGMFRVPGAPTLYLAVFDHANKDDMTIKTDIVEDELSLGLKEHGFRPVTDMDGIPDATLLLKRQTWNTNRAAVVLRPASIPADFSAYLRQVRKHVAWKCGFFPLLWGIGVQVVIIAEGLSASDIEPSRHVARVDNQWAIVQSLCLADTADKTFRAGQSWGQFVTGKFQTCIARTLAHHFDAA